ncbi:DUF2019 domain-containing protein [Nitratireductor luteus]|uniref:DUF2019 domain-containing protein n=1 Tax=Nitratireductor luteus TaxID=2976980 RepID=UPI003B848B1E
MLDLNTRRYNRAFDKIRHIVEELKSRADDQRGALASLLDHPNAQVRLVAATYAHPLFPERAIEVVQTIIDQRIEPQLPFAKDTLDFLKFGPWKERSDASR